MQQQGLPAKPANVTTTSSSKPDPKLEEQRIREHVDMVMKAVGDACIYKLDSFDFSDKRVYNAHAHLIKACANEILSRHDKQFVIDDRNRNVIRFLMLYFNASPLALEVFPDKNYSLDKNIMLIGPVGTGKTLLMDIMRLYLSRIHSPFEFRVFSQTQMLNYFKHNNNIDFFTYNANDSKTYEGKPFHICLNDIGLRTQKFYGNDTEQVIEEFLYARYEIWEQQYKRTHITTNLDQKDIHELFGDGGHNRISDRFKMFNVVPLLGDSRR